MKAKLQILIFTVFSMISLSCIHVNDRCEKSIYYFPFSSENPESIGLDTFVNNWYSGHLTSMNEPNFQCHQTCDQIRLTYLFSWGQPEVFRLEKCGDKISGIYKRTDLEGDYRPGKIIANTSKELSAKDWDLINLEFSRLKSTRKSNEEEFGSDGSMWILERILNLEYTFIERWTLERKSSDQELFEYCRQIQKMTCNEY